LANILALVPMKMGLPDVLDRRAVFLARELEYHEAEIGEHRVEACIRVCPEQGDGRPYSGHAAARNATLEQYLRPHHTHVLWIDADLTDYPFDLAARLHAIDSDGIVAPFPFIEGTSQFYDIQGFIDEQGRRADCRQPYIAGGDLIPMLAVGCCYLAPAALYRTGVRYRPVSGHTEHWSVCMAARALGMRVTAARELTVAHADLPKYGEPWHVHS